MTRWEFDTDEIERILPLEGAHNFREIRDYRTSDGRTIVPGQFYRAATISGLTDTDHRYLSGLNIRNIIDLRSSREIESSPSRWMPESDTVTWAHKDNSAEGDLSRLIAEEVSDHREFRRTMLQIYDRLPEEMSTAFTQILRHLASDRLPLLIHCSAGKDRTGLATAIVLDLLGVDHDTVMFDYLLTNATFDQAYAYFEKHYGISKIDARGPHIVKTMLGAHPEYLQTAFDRIAKDHGSVEGYATERLGLSREELGSLRHRMLHST